MTNICLRGITWNHSRAFPPLVAAAQRYEELYPHVRIEWTKRSLDDFGHAGLSDSARSCDLLVIDHPMLGSIHRDGTLLDLRPRLQPADFAKLESDALGPCLDSYRYEGCLYALPIDAAAVIRTKILDQLTAAQVDYMVARIPMKRVGQLEEVAAVVHFLAGRDCSFVTGQCYDVSGGRSTY